MTAPGNAALPLVEIRDLVVDFTGGAQPVRAVHGVSLRLNRGEALGLVGESGCGKSVTWLALLRLLGPRARVGGNATLDGRSLLDMPEAELERVRGKRIAMIFQDPTSSLNPVHRIGRQIGEALALHRGLSGAAVRAEAKRLLDRVGIGNAGQRLDEYPHQFSGGMNQRAMIAIAIAGEPDILVADEPTTALDTTIQAQILDLLAALRRELNMAMVVISHDLGVVAENCDRVAVMYCGRIVEEAPAERLFARPAHPYTAGLLAALPELEGPVRRVKAIPGSVPEPWKLPHGCNFAPRCAYAGADCARGQPDFRHIAGDWRVACVRTSRWPAAAE